jgi:hypothetical protein
MEDDRVSKRMYMADQEEERKTRLRWLDDVD